MLGRRVPTEKQYRQLRILGSGSAGLSWRRRETTPLLARGWVTADDDGRYFQWVRITPAGLRALADAVDRYGLPDIDPRSKHDRPTESPVVQQLRQQLEDARAACADYARELVQARRTIAGVRRALERSA